MLRKLLVQQINRTNRVALFIRCPNGKLWALEPRYFSSSKRTRKCDQVFPFEGIETAMSRVTQLALRHAVAPNELTSIKCHLLEQSSTSTKRIHVVVYSPKDASFQLPPHLDRYLVNPEDPPMFYTSSHRKLLQAFAADIKRRFEVKVTAEVSAA